MENWIIPLALVLLLVLVTRPWWEKRLKAVGRGKGEVLGREIAERRIVSRLEDFRGTVELPCDVETTSSIVNQSLGDRPTWTRALGHTWLFGSMTGDDMVVVAESTATGSRLRVTRALEVEMQLQGVRNWVALASDVIDRAAAMDIEAHEATQDPLVRDATPTPVELEGHVVTANAFVWRIPS